MNELRFAGHVTLGVNKAKVEKYQQCGECSFVNEPRTQKEPTRWFNPMQVVTVTCMNRTKAGRMRQNRLKETQTNNEKMPPYEQ